jgi:hypothetical protein
VGWPFRREAHLEQRSLADDAGWRRPANSGSSVTRPVGERWLELHDGLVNQFGEGREDGNSLGVLAVHSDAGRPERNNDSSPDTGSPASACSRRGSGHRWGPHGAETEGGSGYRWWPSMRRPRWKWHTVWGGFRDSSQRQARGKSAI